jgi:hypothetical protein
MDSPEDLGDMSSSAWERRTESWGTFLGSEGIGSSGWEVDVVGRECIRLLEAIAGVEGAGDLVESERGRVEKAVGGATKNKSTNIVGHG